MFIDTIGEQHPERVLISIKLEYQGFCALFDLPRERHLEITIHVFAKENSTLEVYEHLKGAEPGRYWLIDSGRYEVSGADPLPLLETYPKTAIDGNENSYEGSFAGMLLERDLREEEV